MRWFLAMLVSGTVACSDTATPPPPGNDVEVFPDTVAVPDTVPPDTVMPPDSTTVMPPSMSSTPIRPLPDNPRFWEFNDQPVLLVGGSVVDNLFQHTDVESELDRLVAAGGNYVRNTLGSRNEGDVQAYRLRAGGDFDLDRFNADYFERLEGLLAASLERGVIVQVELWDRFDYARDLWLENPFNPARNVNYDETESGLAAAYDRHPGTNENRFFFSVPALDDNRMVLSYQEALVDRLLDVTLPYPNVLYTVDNETTAAPEWGAYWATFVKERAAEEGGSAHVSEMWADRDIRDSPLHRITFDSPGPYDFADISQNNHNLGDEHWANVMFARDRILGPRPLNNVKVYGGEDTYGSAENGVDRFWLSLLGGSAAVRFHRPPAGIGLTDRGVANILSAAQLQEYVDLFQAVPDADYDLLSGRAGDEAFLTRVEGSAYAVYFPAGGSVRVDVSDGTGELTLRWLAVDETRWEAPITVDGDAPVQLTAPDEGNWLAVLTR